MARRLTTVGPLTDGAAFNAEAVVFAQETRSRRALAVGTIKLFE